LALTSVFIVHTLFPTLTFSFNFKTPSSSKNNLVNPHSPDNTLRTNGKIETDGTLIINAGVVGSFSTARTTVTLEKQSPIPDALTISLRRSYRGFLLPIGSPITGFPKETLYTVDGTYYALRGNTLYPFISTNAYLTRYPDTFAIQKNKDFLTQYPVAEEWIGFRVGSIVSFADGVFLIVSDTEMRPVGSADIFLAFGYRFEDVLPAHEEEIGIYKRGKIFLLGAEHPDGTLFLDRDTDTYYLTDTTTKRPITNTTYLDFIIKQQSPIIVSSKNNELFAQCTLTPNIFGQHFSCATAIDALRSDFGNDIEITLHQDDADIDINTLEVALFTDKNTRNMLTLLARVKQRVLSRFGYE
ncbi:MAG TPA: hypothetical protein VJH89_03700, partial [Patescibacteria group bacterium]|nr:hypothetical protein [Patescibacteria group bacterium]